MTKFPKGFFFKLDSLSDTALYSAAHNLVSIYKDDLEPSLGDEVVQFAAIINLYKEDCKDNVPKELFFTEFLLSMTSELHFQMLKLL
jgi:hypothetical protein